MSKFASRMTFLLGATIFAAGLISCPTGDSGTTPSTSVKEIDSIQIKKPDKIDYLWGENFAPAGMYLTIKYNDNSIKSLNFLENDKFTQTPSGSFTALTMTKDGYDIQLHNFLTQKGIPHTGQLLLTLSVKETGADWATAKENFFVVNVLPLAGLKLTVDPTQFGGDFYLGQTLPQIAEAGITIQGRFEDNWVDLPETLKVDVRLKANQSKYADIGGIQYLEVIVEGMQSTVTPPTTPIRVHILDDLLLSSSSSGQSTYFGGQEYKDNVKFIEDMAMIPSASITISGGIGSGAFNSAKTGTIITTNSLEFGQYEVTYELWYAVYRWAIANGYYFSDWEWMQTIEEPKEGEVRGDKITDGTILTGMHRGLGIIAQGQNKKKGILPSEADDKYMPVYGIDWADAIVWCNAYAELLAELNGIPTVYPYSYSGMSTPLRDVSSILSPTNVVFNTGTTAFRLPSETEWEATVRGRAPNTGAWGSKYAGSNRINDVAWYEETSGDTPHSPASQDGLKKSVQINGQDIYNMSGNVWEWCQSDDSGSPVMACLKRGGGYNDGEDYCSNNAGRFAGDPKDTDMDTGFRLVRTVSP